MAVNSGPIKDNRFEAFLFQVRAAGGLTMNALFTELYEQIWREANRQLEHEWDDLTLETPELVSEAYLRLGMKSGADWRSEQHVLRYVSQVIRSVLVDWARAKKAQKRGGGAQLVTLVTAAEKSSMAPEDIIELDFALSELADGPGNMAREAKVIEDRYFSGASHAEIAKCHGITERQVYRDLQHGKVWLYRRLRGAENACRTVTRI